MAVVVLVAWLVTAGLGSYLGTVWIRHGGLRQRDAGVTRLPVWLVTANAATAPTSSMPSTPRFSTPARSTTSSPRLAYTSGVAAATVLASIGSK